MRISDCGWERLLKVLIPNPESEIPNHDPPSEIHNPKSFDAADTLY